VFSIREWLWPAEVTSRSQDLLLQQLSKKLDPGIETKIDAGYLGSTHTLVHRNPYRPGFLKRHSCPVV